MLGKNWESKSVDHWNRLLLEVTKTSTTKSKANGHNKRKIFVSTQFIWFEVDSKTLDGVHFRCVTQDLGHQ